MTYVIPIGFILFGLYVFVSRMMQRKDEDAMALYWATVSEPLVFISESAFDSGVQDRHKEAVERIKLHGNRFLTEKDVWLYIYRVDIPIVGDVRPIDMRHSIWYDQVLTTVARRKAEWRDMKAGYIGGHAGHVFGNQVSAN